MTQLLRCEDNVNKIEYLIKQVPCCFTTRRRRIAVSLSTCPVQTFDLDTQPDDQSAGVARHSHTVDMFHSDYRLSQHKNEEVAAFLYSLESLPRNELKCYNNFTTHFPTPRGSIHTTE